MSCQDDATFIGPVTLFCGVETASWKDADFTGVAQFAKAHGITTLFIKVSEVGSRAGNIWYESLAAGGFSGIDHVKQLVEAQGVKFIPYTFPVGPYIDLVQNIQKATDIAVQLLNRYGVVCLDVEGVAWEGQPGLDAGNYMASKLASVPGKLWLSMPADYANNNQNGAMQALSRATNVWMPMAYNDKLTSDYKSQIEQINSSACIQPTLDLSQEFGANDVLANAKKIKADGCLAVSLWYEQFAQQNTTLVDEIVQLFGGSVAPVQPTVPAGGNVKLDQFGCVMTVQKSFQLESGESGDLCGPWSAVAVANSVPPGQTPSKSAEDLDVYTDHMVDTIFGGNVNHNNFLGVSPSDMITILNHIRDDTGLIHYWVIDGKNIPLAIAAGYPCLFSCNEADITAWNKSTQQWVHAYTWQLSAGHVLPVTGIEQGTGNWICPDQLNNSFQGYWPPIYKASDIAKSLSWACIVQVVGLDKSKPWLATIPSGDPTAWPKGFNAQLFAGGGSPSSPPPPPPTTVDNKAKAFSQEWGPNSTSGIAKAAYATYWTPNFAGGQLSSEFQLTGKDGKVYIAQKVHMGIWLWDGSAAHYYPYHAG